jgi:hypothetical protein
MCSFASWPCMHNTATHEVCEIERSNDHRQDFVVFGAVGVRAYMNERCWGSIMQAYFKMIAPPLFCANEMAHTIQIHVCVRI